MEGEAGDQGLLLQMSAAGHEALLGRDTVLEDTVVA